MEIVLVRHGPTEFNSARWLLRHRMRDLLDEYAKSRMFSQAPTKTVALLAQCAIGTVVCSAGSVHRFGPGAWPSQCSADPGT
jgi:hypothetical protein